MSAEDETFDIDLYGDEPEAEPVQPHHGDSSKGGVDAAQEVPLADQSNDVYTIAQPEPAVSSNQPAAPSLKRKAPNDEETNDSRQHDERPLDQGAQVSLKLTELQWWTTEEDLRFFCAQGRCEDELVEVAFGEHKINGKSRGEAYLELQSPQAAGMVKRAIERANADVDAGSKSAGKSKISVWYTAPGNPFRAREGQAKKESGGKYGQQQGAYNSYNNNNNNRGSFAGRGRGGFNRGGGQWSNQSNNTNSNANFNAGMMNGNMGFFPNMMNNMMGAGFGMNMGAMGMMNGMMAGRGGGNMMNRGGFNQNFQRGGYNGWENNKKPRTE